MKKTKLSKMFTIVLAVIFVFAFGSTAFAAATTISMQVTGGDSDPVATLHRDNEDGVRLIAAFIIWNEQSGFKYRGYYGNTKCSELKSITGVGNYTAFYTYKYDGNIKVMASIASTSENEHLSWIGGVGC